jgi:hypothetical protein
MPQAIKKKNEVAEAQDLAYKVLDALENLKSNMQKFDEGDYNFQAGTDPNQWVNKEAADRGFGDVADMDTKFNAMKSFMLNFDFTTLVPLRACAKPLV